MGSATVASLLWLRYAKSAGKARGILGGAGEKVMRTLRTIHCAANTIQKRTEEIDHFVQELIDLGRIQKSHAEGVFEATLQRFEETAELIRKNLALSSDDVTALLSDLRAGVKQLAVKPEAFRAA